MSTYLLAFVVGELEATDPLMIGRTPLRIWCVPGKRHLTAFAGEIAAFSLAFFEQYYGLPYPGEKLDLLAIPDFAAGAMENLGAITFRETALLVDAEAAAHAELERIADVVAHENAHMWFGGLVTMSWWNGIWLNEAFATFMEMLAVDAWKPEWRRWETFGVSRAAALGVDGLHATRPIEFHVGAPREADAMFDVLTYEKGAAVLRMLEQHLGAEVFRAGVRDYLRAHAYGNADTVDIWAALGRAAGQPIPEVMDGWIFTPGYPLVTARREGGALVLAQPRFTSLPEPPPRAPPPGAAPRGRRSAGPAAGGRRGRPRQRGRARLLPRALRGRPPRAAPRAAAGARAHRALQPRRRRVGGHGGGAHGARRLPGPDRALPPRARSQRLVPAPPPAGAPAGRRPPPRSAGRRGAARTSSRGSSAATCCARSARSATTPRCRRAPPRATRPGARTRTCSPPSSRSSPTRATPRATRSSWGASAPPPRRRRSSATSTRSPASGRRRCSSRRSPPP